MIEPHARIENKTLNWFRAGSLADGLELMPHLSLPCHWTFRRAALLGLLSAGLALGWETFRIFFGDNIHEVLPGKVYRSAQLSPQQLEAFIRAKGIRTVVNLRGACPVCDWYMNEARALHGLNVGQEDVFLSAGRFPPASELRRLVDIFDRGEYPMLLHCRQGADRTGISSMIVKLLQPGVGLDEAGRQLSPRYGHLPLSRTANLDRYMEYYTDWLTDEGLAHAPAVFRKWLAAPHCPGAFQCRFELLDAPQVAAGTPVTLRLRATNCGRDVWHFKPSCGIALMYMLNDPDGKRVYSDKAGLVERQVAGGQSIDFTLCFPALRPGRYTLFADLGDPSLLCFQVGSEPLEMHLHVLAEGTAPAERLVGTGQ